MSRSQQQGRRIQHSHAIESPLPQTPQGDVSPRAVRLAIHVPRHRLVHVADLTQPFAGQPWAAGRYDRILLDPSRAGAEAVLAGVPEWDARRIVYVSCNPATLARDAGLLVHRYGYRLVHAGVMDMFPQTAHVESIAVFER